MARILPMKILFVKEVILESFTCEHYGFFNNTVKGAGQIQHKGSRYTSRVD